MEQSRSLPVYADVRSGVTLLTFAEMCTGLGHYKRNRIMSMSIHDNRSVRQSLCRLAERQRLNQLFISARSPFAGRYIDLNDTR
ncbi:unnamed protein product [Lasius platythorax]|uniref:Uncharacterized protein n=1 Tax=Lasius platythorax TaxID=488582 RepID=A0AAV2NX93_9HYME